MYEFDKCNDELEKIELRTKLKKRYVVQQQTLTKAREQKQSKEKLQFKKWIIIFKFLCDHVKLY